MLQKWGFARVSRDLFEGWGNKYSWACKTARLSFIRCVYQTILEQRGYDEVSHPTWSKAGKPRLDVPLSIHHLLKTRDFSPCNNPLERFSTLHLDKHIVFDTLIICPQQIGANTTCVSRVFPFLWQSFPCERLGPPNVHSTPLPNRLLTSLIRSPPYLGMVTSRSSNQNIIR